jgi:poly(ADP-ribose) glycohydrolase ARH3
MTTSVDNVFGSLLGLVLGDAIGARFEGLPSEQLRRQFATQEDALTYSLQRDQWRYTDDGQMALAVARYLGDFDNINPNELMRYFVDDYEPWRGYGRGARVLIEAFREAAEYEFLAEHLFPGGSLGNGAAMRSAPIGLRFAQDTTRIKHEAKQSAWPTHRHPLGIEGSQLIALATAYAANTTSITPRNLADYLLTHCATVVFENRLKTLVNVEDWRDLEGFGNGIEAHESVVTALGCFSLFPKSFERAIATALWLGGDTDTIAAMTGALVGAHIGSDFADSLPIHKLEDGSQFIEHLKTTARRIVSRISPD